MTVPEMAKAAKQVFVRLDMKLPSDLKEFAKDYARQRTTTVSEMIREFLQDKFSNVTEVFIDPELENSKAIHIYEKVGFKKLEQFIAPWHLVPHWLMHLEIKNLNRSINYS